MRAGRVVTMDIQDMSSVEEWRATLAAELKAAMKARDKVALAALRSLSARVANAEAVPVDVMPRAGAVEAAAIGVGVADAERRTLTAADLQALVSDEVAEHEEAARQREALGRIDEATDLRRQAQIIKDLRVDPAVP